MVHVLSGPDHLSALATLSVGSSCKAFSLGIRWGLGHSTGLVVIAVVFLSLDGEMDIDKIGEYCDWIVGLFMIVLGIYGLYNAKAITTEILEEQESLQRAIDEAGLGEESEKEKGEINLGEEGGENEYFNANGREIELANLLEEHHNHSHNHCNDQETCCWGRVDMRDPMTQRVVAFSIGIIHGIAGPGGVLGVLPAVQMHSWSKSMLYLGFFCLTSTLCMGAFAAGYGDITRRMGNNEKTLYRLAIFSASLSIIVGIIWIVLLACGKLTDIFP